MANPYFRFKQFSINQDKTAMKVTTDSSLFGAWAAGYISQQKMPVNSILDIGTGTGLLSLMIAQKNKAPIDAIEIDSEAAEQASENVLASPWAQQIGVVNEDLLQWQPHKTWDVIIANPPFYQNDLPSPIAAKNTAHHGTALQLHELFNFVKKHLAKNGRFYVLLPYVRRDVLHSLLPSCGLHLHIQLTVTQTTHHLPFRLLVQGGLQPAELSFEKTVAIKDSLHNYTDDFIAFLKDYYLYL